ncbi:MAG: hypothetical protein ACLT4C_04375 [Butyricicoccus sp.]
MRRRPRHLFAVLAERVAVMVLVNADPARSRGSLRSSVVLVEKIVSAPVQRVLNVMCDNVAG